MMKFGKGRTMWSVASVTGCALFMCLGISAVVPTAARGSGDLGSHAQALGRSRAAHIHAGGGVVHGTAQAPRPTKESVPSSGQRVPSTFVLAPRVKFAHVASSVASVPFSGDNMTFQAVSPPAGVISEQSALASAEQIHGPIWVDSSYTAEAEYGSFTDSVMGSMGADGKVVLEYVDRPVWIVTFVSARPRAIPAPAPQGTATYSKSQWTFIVDAYSGKTLLGI